MIPRGALGLLVALAVTTEAHQQPSDTFRSSREILTIETSVRGVDGQALKDLQPSDFTVRIDGEPRRVLTARLYGTDAGRLTNDTAPIGRFTSSAETSPGRVVVFVIDRESIVPGGERAVFDTASRMIDKLSSADAVGVVPIPGAGIDLTRDHAAVSRALREALGLSGSWQWQHDVTWEEARAVERRDTRTVEALVDRECPRGRAQPECVPEVMNQARDMLTEERRRVQTVLSSLGDLLDRLGPIRAPKHVVLLSGGLPIDLEFTPYYQKLELSAAQSHAAIFVVHVDRMLMTAERSLSAGALRPQDTGGLASIASMTGGEFYMASGGAGGIFDRIASETNDFYELGVESRPSDGNGKPHRVDVKVSRADARVRAPAATAATPVRPPSSDDMIRAALAQPTDVAELPLEVAPYVTMSSDPERARVIIAAGTPPGTAPADWGYTITDGTKVIASTRIHVTSPAADPWSDTVTVDVPRGRYRLRTGIADAGGRVGTVDLPLTVGFRAGGAVEAGDLMVGTIADGHLVPRARVTQSDRTMGMIELSSSQPLADTEGVLQLTPGGSTAPAVSAPLLLRTRRDDKTIVIAEASLDVSALAPGRYTASAILRRAGASLMRVSRVIDVVPGSAPAPPSAATPGPTPPAPAAASAARASSPKDPLVGDLMARVGRYVEAFGERASLIVGVEQYQQQLLTAVSGEPSRRKLVAEFALVKTSDAAGWSGFRDVLEVDGRRVVAQPDRLRTILGDHSGDLTQARRIADESARYNLGPIRRNFNDPTAALFFFGPSTQSRFTFSRRREAFVDGIAVTEIDFKEHGTPTLIRTTDGRNMPAQGTLWVVPEDGTVVRTRFAINGYSGRSSTSTIDVTYARDSRLALWLPATMQERHVGSTFDSDSPDRHIIGRRTHQSIVVGTATYSDFKRFETSATFKIK